MINTNGDYYSRYLGYVIEERTFASEAAAIEFLLDTCGMTEGEADSYLYRLRHEYAANRARNRKMQKGVPSYA